ncbi:MAG: hypothetical protein WCI17_10250, partial [bacterium]
TAVEFCIEFTRQDGRLLWASDVWRPIAPAVGTGAPAVRRDPMLGSLAPDGRKGVLVKNGARFGFRLLDADHMEVEFVSFEVVGDFKPTAFYAVLTREGAAARAPAITRPPSLLGSWRSPYRYAQAAGPLSASLHLEVTRQDGALLWINDIWPPVDPATGKPSTTEMRKDLLIGSLDATGRAGVVTKEGARFGLELLDADRMLVEFVRMGGHGQAPTAFYSILRRNGVEPAVTGTHAPDLRGNWESSSVYAQPAGPVTAPFRLQVMRQDGLLLWVDDIWHPLDPATGKPLPEEKRDPLLGSLRPDGSGGVLAKADARFAFTVLAPDRILVEFDCVRAEGNDSPTAFYTVLNRRKL